jgi:ABC-type sulfate transport system permease component
MLRPVRCGGDLHRGSQGRRVALHHRSARAGGVLSFSAASLAAAVNLALDLRIALMVRYRFPGRKPADA